MTKKKVRISNNGHIAYFHIDWSSGTAAVRGNKPINIYPNRKYYWEVLLKDRIFGTSMMIGLTTSKAKLYSNSYINLIGENKFGWVSREPHFFLFLIIDCFFIQFSIHINTHTGFIT